MDVIVVGAGVAGLSAARELTDAGYRVVVVDKGRRPGGRMASRSVGGARWDHGAQFFTAKDEAFRRRVQAWRDRGVVDVWYHGSPDPGGSRDGHPRYRGAPHMRSLPEHLASRLDVRCGARVAAVRPGQDGWRVEFDDADAPPLTARALALTPPVPQTLALLDAGDARLDDDLRARLDDVAYEPTLAVLAEADVRGELGNGGALRLGGEPVEWLGDNRRKGVTDAPALTVHAGPETSRELWDADDDVRGATLAAAAADVVGAEVRPVAVHAWRYSKPVGTVGEPCLTTSSPAPLVFAGDAMLGGRVEGAALSGTAAGRALAETLAG